VPEDRHLRREKALTYRIDQVVEIGEDLLDGHGRSRDVVVKRLAGAA